VKKKNSIDTLVESLYSEFSKITNFQLTQTDPIGNKFFHFIVRYISELNAFQNLFIQYYLPASLKSITDFKKELKHSKYRAHFNFDEVELKENYYETVRLGYVGAYHKYESYLKNIIPVLGKLFLGNPNTYKMLGIYTEAYGNSKNVFKIFNERKFQIEYIEYFFGCATGIKGKKLKN